MATISENLQTILSIKSDIKDAIEAKGVTVGDASFGSYAGKISEITAGSAEILLPRYFRIAYSGAGGEKFNGVSTIWEWPSNLKFTEYFMWSHGFEGVRNVKNLPPITTVHPTDLYFTTDFSYMFSGAEFNISDNIEFWNSLDYSNAEYMNSMFQYMRIGGFNELRCNSTVLKDISYLFYMCYAPTLPPIIEFDDLSRISSVYCVFNIGNGTVRETTSLRLSNLGAGFTSNLASHHHTLDLSKLRINNLSVITTVFNDLASTTVTDATIKLSSNTYNLLSADDIAIATSKGWIVQSA